MILPYIVMVLYSLKSTSFHIILLEEGNGQIPEDLNQELFTNEPSNKKFQIFDCLGIVEF